MRIAVIGAGTVGGAVTRATTEAGHGVTVTGKSADTAGELAAQTAANGWSWRSAWTLAGPSSLA